MFALLRFLAGILLVQAASVALVLVAGVDGQDWRAWLPIATALAIIGLVSAFWFTTVAAGARRDAAERLRADFAREREKLRVSAEREKTRLVRKGQREIASETRRATARANRKVALTVAGASALGLFMMLASFMTLGLAVLSAAGGALGGYIAGRRGFPRGIGRARIAAPDAPERRLPPDHSA